MAMINLSDNNMEADFLQSVEDLVDSSGQMERLDRLQRRIEELERVVNGLKLQELDRDGERIGDVVIPNSMKFTSGDTSMFGLSDPTVNQQFGFLSTGKDYSDYQGYDLTEVITWYDGNNGLSAFYGRGGPIVVARDAVTTAGSTTISSPSIASFEDNSLAGKIVTVTTTSATEGFVIASNTGNTLVTSGGAPSETDDQVQIEVLNTVYLGAGSSPWKRAYVEEGTVGGVRFGLGATGNGQNGLLYMNSAGDLYWRRKNGGTTKLN